jgi:ribosome biogenesis protein MAK21
MKATMPNVDDDNLMDDSDEDDEALMLDDDSTDSGHSDDSDGPEDQDSSDNSTEEGLSLAEASDDDDLIPLDEMGLEEGLIEYDGSDAGDDGIAGVVSEEEEEWNGILGVGAGKRKRKDEEKGKRKRQKSLPTFASYEDYAKLIEDGPEDDI